MRLSDSVCASGARELEYAARFARPAALSSAGEEDGSAAGSAGQTPHSEAECEEAAERLSAQLHPLA